MSALRKFTLPNLADIRRFIHIYDPSNFSLIYSLKALIAIFFSVVINYSLFGYSVVVWAVIMPIYVFFLNTLITDKDTKVVYLAVFVVLSCLAVFAFDFIVRIDGGKWLILPAAVFAFIVGISLSYSKDLQTILTSVFVTALVACIYVLSNVPISVFDEICVIIIGGGVAITTRFLISFGRYGRFTIRTFSSLIVCLRSSLEHIYEISLFLDSKERILTQINNLKINLNTQSAKIKDPHLIKDIRRVLFYLYRIEDICNSLYLLHNYLISTEKKPIYSEILNEIDYNLGELSKIFVNEKPLLKSDVLKLIDGEDKVFVSLAKVIYNKMDFFKKVSNDEIEINVKIERSKGLGAILKTFSLNNTTFRYALKYAFIIAISVFIATYFQIENGVWIAIGAISIIRPSFGNIKEASKEYLFGSIVGFIIGFVVVLLFRDSIFFVAIIIVAIFFVLYLKVYPYKVWVAALSVGLVIMFSLINENFISLILARFVDILIGALLVIVVFSTIFINKYDKSVIASLDNIITSLKSMLESIATNENTALMGKESDFFNEASQFSELLAHIPKEYHTIYTKDDLESFHKVRTYINLTNSKIMRLSEYLSKANAKNEEQILYKNDIHILNTRFDMLGRMIKGANFFFRIDIEGRILSTDREFSNIISSIFMLQNEIYAALYPTLKRIG